jgi:dipeptidyl aminopeptidase/acylaminoacyl peptidase
VMEKDSNPIENEIAVINIDGTGLETMYSSHTSTEGFRNTLFLVFCPDKCRLTWSPDNRYIAFVASSGEAYDFGLYRLDLKTRKITSLIDTSIVGNNILGPDWGP